MRRTDAVRTRPVEPEPCSSRIRAPRTVSEAIELQSRAAREQFETVRGRSRQFAARIAPVIPALKRVPVIRAFGGLRPYTPVYPLWADGLVKRRWLDLPAGKKIDTSDMDHWSFPVGTRFWKEFATPSGTVLETRLIEKIGAYDPNLSPAKFQVNEERWTHWVKVGAQPSETVAALTGGSMSWLARDSADHGTLWAATSAGRIFVTHNADAADPATVTWHRIDNATSPTRFPSVCNFAGITSRWTMQSRSRAIGPKRSRQSQTKSTLWRFSTPRETSSP